MSTTREIQITCYSNRGKNEHRKGLVRKGHGYGSKPQLVTYLEFRWNKVIVHYGDNVEQMEGMEKAEVCKKG